MVEDHGGVDGHAITEGLRRTWRRTVRSVSPAAELGLPAARQMAVSTAQVHVADLSRWLRVRARARSLKPISSVPGALKAVDPGVRGGRFRFEGAELDVRFLSEDTVCLTWGDGLHDDRVEGVSVRGGGIRGDELRDDGIRGDELRDDGSSEAVEWALTGEVTMRKLAGPRFDIGGGWAFCSSALEVSVGGDGAVTLSTPGGEVLRRQRPPVRADGTWTAHQAIRDGERLVGLGEQAGAVDLRLGGPRHSLWNHDPIGGWETGTDPLYMPLPVLVGVHEAGDVMEVWDNTGRGSLSLLGSTMRWRFATRSLRQVFSVGSPPALVARLGALVGRPAFPPRWSLGYHHSRWGYRSQGEIEEVVEGFAHMGVPLSAVHLDIDYMRGYRVFTADTERFADMSGLADRSLERGTRLVAIIDPGVKLDQDFDVYRSGAAAGHFCRTAAGDEVVGAVWPGRTVFPDFTDPACREWWAAHYRRLTDMGIAGVWHDMNEPTSLTFFGDRTLPASTRHSLEGRGGDHLEAHNVYGVGMNRAGYEGLYRAEPDRRPWILSRSGWLGGQRHSWNWTGDTHSDWAGLRQQIPTLIGLGLSGVAFSGCDIGGFDGEPSEELYIRWLQLGVLLPFCRTHCTHGVAGREPWKFSAKCQEIVAACVRFRYRLLPYLYQLSREASLTGAPLVRPTAWPLPDTLVDRDLWDVDDQYLLGNNLLVGPVCAPDVRCRPVHLPPGQWSGLWSAGKVTGRSGEVVEVDAPLERPAVMVRRGSIIALDDAWAEGGSQGRLLGIAGDASAIAGEGSRSDVDGASARMDLQPDHSPKLTSFHCWPTAGGFAEGQAYDDLGDGYGSGRVDDLRIRRAVPGESAELTWRRVGDYEAPATVRLVIHDLAVGYAESDGARVEVSNRPGAAVIDLVPFSKLILGDLADA